MTWHILATECKEWALLGEVNDGRCAGYIW